MLPKYRKGQHDLYIGKKMEGWLRRRYSGLSIRAGVLRVLREAMGADLPRRYEEPAEEETVAEPISRLDKPEAPPPTVVLCARCTRMGVACCPRCRK